MTTPQKQELKFPVDWEFRIVCESTQTAAVRTAAEIFLKEHNVTPEFSDGLASKGGKYGTLKFPVTLTDRAMMNTLANGLAALPGVKFVL